MRTILAPGVEWREIDKSQYGPAMVGTNCYVMGFTDKGEPYQPMEFTNVAAWQNYYGTPDNEAERYAYAAVNEVLNHNGRLYFARLPYDNAAFEKVVAFKYKLSKDKVISCAGVDGATSNTPFFEIKKLDSTIDHIMAIEPAQQAALYDLSAIDEYRTDEAKVANNTFMIADIAFNTYGKIPEDKRKNEKREMIGIMPVVTTAANAMYAQALIDVEKQNVIGYETIGVVRTLDAAMQLSADYPKLSNLVANTILESDMAKRLNTKTYYKNVQMIDVREVGSFETSAEMTDEEVSATICAEISNSVLPVIGGNTGSISSWNGSYQCDVETTYMAGEISSIRKQDDSVYYKDEETYYSDGLSLYYDESLAPSSCIGRIEDFGELSTLKFSFLRPWTETMVNTAISVDPDTYADYDTLLSRFGWHNPDGDDSVPDTVSQEANSFFPTIEFDGSKFDRDNLKKIGVVVYKLFMDPAEGNKINFEPVEAYAGSLCKTDKDPNTGVTTFIDTIINSQSKYINFFSNCFNTKADNKYYHETLDMLVVRPGTDHPEKLVLNINKVADFEKAFKVLCNLMKVEFGDVYKPNTVGDIAVATDALVKLVSNKYADQDIIDAINAIHDIEVCKCEDPCKCLPTLGTCRTALDYVAEVVSQEYSEKDTICPSLGFFSEMTKEDISITKSLYDGINKSFEKVSDINQLDIDVIPDAGLANIASFIKAIYGEKGQYDLMVTDDAGNSLLGMWKCDSNNITVKTWKTVEQKLDNFCKNVRKDCMFIADGPRPFVLQGQKKIIRPSKPANTIDEHIIPNIKWITGLNTSYGACYVDWFEQADDYSGDFFWCPPSIKAMGVYINTDVNFNYWDAPAGLNRGVIAATDVAFSPTIKQAGSFYEKNFNYAVNYPSDGIVLEGQKTLQAKPSAFDRVNVRRLFCRLERQAYKVSRYFVYEGNTAYTRQRLVDALTPYFDEAKVGGGVYDYKIKCDETNNTDDTIDRNELHVSIGLKPTKTAEFILLDFVCLRTGGSWSEAGF